MRIRAAGLAKRYPGSERAVLDGLDLDVEADALAVIGPSGGGKSTFLRILGGLLAPDAGTVEMDGERVDYDEASLPAYRASIGYVFQQNGLFQHLSARENVVMPLVRVHGLSREEAGRRADELLGRFGLAEVADQLPAQLSGGQQQRAAIARAISPRPRLVLLDEPTSALYPAYTVDVLDLLDALRRDGMRFVIVTHEMGFARRACDACAFLDGGRIVECGPSEQVFEAPAHEQTRAFLGRLLEWR